MYIVSEEGMPRAIQLSTSLLLFAFRLINASRKTCIHLSGHFYYPLARMLRCFVLIVGH